MNTSAVGNPLLSAAALAVQKRDEAQLQKNAQAGPAAPPKPTDQPQAAAAPSRSDLDRLADEVLAIFEDSPDRLETLVATLKRLEGKDTPAP